MPRLQRTHKDRQIARRFAPSGIELVIDALATYRITRLATVDTIPAAVAFRERVTRWSRTSGHPAVEELVHCPWCVGFWIAATVVVARRSAGPAWDRVARVLALSAASGMIAHYLSDEVVEVKAADADAGPSPLDRETRVEQGLDAINVG